MLPLRLAPLAVAVQHCGGGLHARPPRHCKCHPVAAPGAGAAAGRGHQQRGLAAARLAQRAQVADRRQLGAGPRLLGPHFLKSPFRPFPCQARAHIYTLACHPCPSPRMQCSVPCFHATNLFLPCTAILPALRNHAALPAMPNRRASAFDEAPNQPTFGGAVASHECPSAYSTQRVFYSFLPGLSHHP